MCSYLFTNASCISTKMLIVTFYFKVKYEKLEDVGKVNMNTISPCQQFFILHHFFHQIKDVSLFSEN